MRVVKVSIRNFMGIEELDFEPGSFNVASGKNGEGKTSFIEAIKSLVKRGQDATLLRKGAKKGEVVLVMDDGTTIARRMTEKSVQPLTIERDGHKVAQPTQLMDELADIVSVNPVDFMRAQKKDRVNILLDSLPVKADADALSEIVGHPVRLNPNVSPFEAIEQLRQAIFDERTGTNRALKEKRATIDQLSQTIPDDMPTPEDEAGLLAEINRIDAGRDAEMLRIDTKLSGIQQSYEKVTTTYREEAESDIAELAAEIEALQKEITERREKMHADVQFERDALTKMQAAAEAQRQITLTNHAEARSGVAGQLEAIRAVAQQAARIQNTRDTIDSMVTDAAALEADSKQQSISIDGIDAYKSELLSALPVSGLEVRAGEIFRNGIAFDRLNTAQQIAIAVEIAKLRAGDLGIVCIDGIEILDADNFSEFQRQIVTAGLQAFVTRVADGDFELAAVA